MRRIAVTGLGVVSPLGHSVDALFEGLVAGRSAVRRLSPFLCERLESPIGAAAEFDGSAHFAAPRLKMLDRVSQFALVAAAQALVAAGIDFNAEDRSRCGVCVGTGLGGAAATDEGYDVLYAQRSQRLRPYTVLAAMHNAPAAWIAIDHGLAGPTLTFSTACSSSSVAIGEAARRIRFGEAELMIAGGSEAPLTYGALSAWEALRTLATVDRHDPSASCRPFSRHRSGLVLGEGAAFVVLEEFERAVRRGALIHAELAGYGLSTDHEHITRPTVAGQSAAMRAALASAALPATAIGYVNAHGTGTLQNDAVETAALKEVLDAKVRGLPVSSTKSMHGHLLGAAGALEFVIAVRALERGIAPPTMHLDAPDPACDLDYCAGTPRRDLRLEAVMSNSFAFGGTNAVLIARRP